MPPKLGFGQLETGYEFSPSNYKLDSTTVARYIEAVEETSGLYKDTQLVPPSAVAAYAQATLMDYIELLPGTIHVSQDLEFLGVVNVGDAITSHARVSRRQERGGMRLLNVELDVLDQNSKLIMKVKNSFILPESH